MNEIGLEGYSKVPWTDIFWNCKDDPSQLPKLLSRYLITKQSLVNLSQKPQNDFEAYGRKILFANNQIEVMLANWAYRGIARPHNHGASKGLIWFAVGDFYEKHFHFVNNNLLADQDPHYYKENSVAMVNQNDIHSCYPETTGLTLHIYSPPIHNMKVWDEKLRRTLIVADHCGAWIPEDPSLIIESIPWS